MNNNSEKKKKPATDGKYELKQPNANQAQPSYDARRQSAPQPTVQEEAMKAYQTQQAKKAELMASTLNGTADGVQNGFNLIIQPIGKEQIHTVQQTLMKYKEGKANLERKIIENEQYYKLRHWECLRDKSDEIQPTSAWLFNCIANKHADAMDNIPAPAILPREESDKGEAEMLTSIIPVVLDQNEFEQVYSDVTNYKLKSGTGVYGVFWDGSKLNGLGDISIKKIDLLNLFWESGIQDIQSSRNLFAVEPRDNDLLINQYPQLQGKLGTGTIDIAKYVYDDNVDTSNKSVVVDWYYKKNQNGKTVLHYCKYVNDEVLFSTENNPEYRDKGWYDHGLYPFVFDVLYPMEGTPCGFGYIDIGKDDQNYIDRGNQAIMKNMLANARPRYFIRSDGAVKEEEFADTTKDFIHVDGNLGQDSVLPVQPNTLNNIYVEVINNKIDELKETTGNRDISTGGTTAGVTAASAIAAMQEAGSKLSRDNNKASYRAFRKICLMIIELIRQFYDMPRCFRIMGENGAARFVQYSNAGILPQFQGNDFGQDMGYRLPLFDIEVTAQKQSPYSKLSNNELALQFYQAGFFNPQMASQALACLDMMDFDRKHFVMQKITKNAQIYQQMMMAQMVNQPMMGGNVQNVEDTEALGGNSGEEASNTKKARQRVADSTSPT